MKDGSRKAVEFGLRATSGSADDAKEEAMGLEMMKGRKERRAGRINVTRTTMDGATISTSAYLLFTHTRT